MVDWMPTLAVHQHYGTLASLRQPTSIHPVRLQSVRSKDFVVVTECQSHPQRCSSYWTTVY